MFVKAAPIPWTMKSVRQAPGLFERRDAPRTHTVCRFARVAGLGDEGLCRVCNISDRGMMIRSGRRPDPGRMFSVSLSENLTLETFVVWSDASHVGMRFLEPVSSTALLSALAAEQKLPNYRPLRLRVDGRALAFDEAGVHPVKVLNISRHGVGVGHSNRL